MVKTMKKVEKRFLVVEDNGGGLTLVVFGENGKAEYLHNLFEYSGKGIIDALRGIFSGDDPAKDWDGGVENPQEFWETQFVNYKNDWRVIADNERIYYDKMGHAGQNAFARRRIKLNKRSA
jgi:hypothetical protein